MLLLLLLLLLLSSIFVEAGMRHQEGADKRKVRAPPWGEAAEKTCFLEMQNG